MNGQYRRSYAGILHVHTEPLTVREKTIAKKHIRAYLRGQAFFWCAGKRHPVAAMLMTEGEYAKAHPLK